MQHIKLNKNLFGLKRMNIAENASNNLAKGFIDSLYYQIKLTEKCCKMLAKQMEEKLELEITLDELTALGTINLHNGNIHQRDLAKIILKDRANTGRMLNNLEKKGYIKRVEKTKNKRQANMINITEKGLKSLDELTNIIKPMFDDVHKKMTEEELDYMKNGLKKLRDVMEETLEIHI